jgi:peptidylprolyl isomerase
MMRRTVALGALGLLALCVAGCGDAFEEGRAKPLTGGLKYIDIKEGVGEPVQEGDRVELHYKGWLKEAQKPFENTYESGRSIPLTLGGDEFLRGVHMGVEGMKPGGTRRLFIPSPLGYGPRGAGREVPPDTNLVMDVELIKVISRVERAPDFDNSKATKTTTGLKYIDLKEGTGPAVKDGDTVKVHYTGWLAKNGKLFDSSLPRGVPFKVKVGTRAVIKGWDEGLVGLKAGSKRRLYIPAQLGYGSEGRDAIPPNADLLFDVEVVSIEPAP